MILYKDDEHSYTHEETGVRYTSATSLIKQFEPDKDWDAIAAKYAIKHNTLVEKETGVNPGTTGDYWREQWKNKADKATDKGSKFHNRQEEKVLEMYKGLEKFPSPVVNNEKRSRPLKLEEGVYPELLIYNETAKIAGQADLVIIKDNKINILDYKTNKEIDTQPYVRRDGSFDTFKSPISHLPYTTANKYYLQLNLYAFMLKRHNPNLEIGEMVIRHIKFDEEDENKAIGHVDMQVPKMQLEIKMLINSILGL